LIIVSIITIFEPQLDHIEPDTGKAMKSITIHNLDSSLDSLIREKARKQGTSLNRTIQMLLKKALGLQHGTPENRRNDFIDLFGVWSQQDETEFQNNIQDFNTIDESDWK